MNTHLFFRRLCHSPIFPCAVVVLVALAWSSLAFCGEIHDAARDGNLAKVQALLKDNPDLVFSKDDLGRTPLHIAAGSGHKDVAELLLANHADVHAKDNHGRTALHWAALGGHKDVAEWLLAHQADVNAKDDFGRTALHWAAVGGHKDAAELLLAHQAYVNAEDNVGRTALHWAALGGHKDVAELLLAHQAYVNAKSDNGRTPLDLAASQGHEDVEELLASAMAAKEPTPAPAPTPAPESTPAPSPSPPILPSQLTASSIQWVSRLSSQCNLHRRKSACRELARVAVENKDASVRSAAVANLADQSLLAKIAVEDKDARVRSAAADSQAGYNSKTGLSKAEALVVLGVFLRDAYNSHVPLIAHALARRDANSHLPPGWAPMEQFAATMLANVHIGGFITLKDFGSIDETGYEFTSTRLYCDGRSRDPSSHLPVIYFHLDQGQPVRVRFADVRGIKMTYMWSVGETYAYLLSDPRGVVHNGQGSSILDRFLLYNGKDPYGIFPALHTLCPNLK